MACGTSTHAYLWRASRHAPRPLALPDMLRDTAALGGGVLQICDHPPVAELDARGLAELSDLAGSLGIALELGTRGVARERRERLELAGALGATLVRSMVNTPGHRPAPDEAVALLRRALPRYEAAGVTLGLETYEQIPTGDLLRVVRAVASPNLGIVLDPGHCVAALEHPVDGVEATAPLRRQRPRQGLRVHPPGRPGRLHAGRLPAGRRAPGPPPPGGPGAPGGTRRPPDRRALAALAG